MGKWLARIKENDYGKTSQLSTDFTAPVTRRVERSMPVTANPAKNKAPIRNVKKIHTLEDLMALSLHSCIWCRNYTYLRGYCEQYQVRLPEPVRECRCVHYEPRRH